MCHFDKLAIAPSPFKMRHTVTVGAFLSLFAHLTDGVTGDKVRLKDVQVLTLRQGQYTTGRRSHPVPQLNCRGGSAGCQDQPSVVQCYNRGSDGRDTQWECKADMKSQKFGLIQVTCEGYDFPQDEYVLLGSCRLEYYLERTEFGGGSLPSVPAHQRHREEDLSSETLLNFVNAIIFVLAAIGFCFVCLCCMALCAESADRHSHTQLVIVPEAGRSPSHPTSNLYYYAASRESPYGNYGVVRISASEAHREEMFVDRVPRRVAR
ncbi:store-operated calcium entry-associated regulatory factor-like [Dermacentor albipictus]|uniref:store-operated calcium entry-associated regulatory factor-like n=1 Tax=Dermacentor albipictus TaxID=60249 RepID=UPI0038FCA549